jgi:hypothetical protein
MATDGATVGHGLGVSPKACIIVKITSDSQFCLMGVIIKLLL